MQTPLFRLLLMLIPFASFSQSARLNQLDASGKKEGKWVLYLDKEWKEVKDTNTAVCCHYTYFDHGTILYPMGGFGRGLKLQAPANGEKFGNKELLNGEYKWINKDGLAAFILVFRKGEFVSYKEYYDSGKLHEYFDYANKWKGEPYTYCMKIYYKNGKMQAYYNRWEDNVWIAWGGAGDSTFVDTLKTTGDSAFVTSSYFKNGTLICKQGEILLYLISLHTKTMQHGMSTNWYTNGQKQWEGTFYYGKRNGSIASWYENGQKKEEGAFSNDKKTGVWKHWDEKGKETDKDESKTK